jgi:anthranilate phosphoribosyltransferase
MSLREAIEVAARGDEVPPDVIEAAFEEIVGGKASPVATGGLLVALRTKGETVGEIVAAARTLRAHAETAPFPDPRTVDTCGTGGDVMQTFNISTTVAFVVAGAGVPVAKHGNRAASSRSGSIDVFEALGVRVDLAVDEAVDILAEVGIAPFFARRAHPAMRFVAPVREQLGIRTLMNCLGPLLNPVGVRFQLVGVYDPCLVAPLAGALGELGAERALVVHGSDGMDEVTTTGPTRAALWNEGGVQGLEIRPSDVGIPNAVPGALRGGDARENARITLSVLEGESGARRDIVLINAAAALWAATACEDLVAGMELARESVDSGAARDRLAKLVAATAA